jgi:RNA polymerase primary sigma factor
MQTDSPSAGSRRPPYTVQELFPAGVHRARPLSAWTERNVARLARAGNERALELLLRANMPFVVFVAGTLKRFGVPRDDLVCAGNEGLYRAVKNFDPERGFKLISFARKNIHLAMFGVINKLKFPYEVPRAVSKLAAQIRRYEADHFVRFGNYPSDEDLVEKFKLSADDLLTFQQLQKVNIPFDLPVGFDKIRLFSERYVDPGQVPTDRRAEAKSQWAAFMKALGQFSETNQKIIKFSFGILGKNKLPVAAIARELGISEGKVNKRRPIILEKIKNMMQGGPGPDPTHAAMPEFPVHQLSAGGKNLQEEKGLK